MKNTLIIKYLGLFLLLSIAVGCNRTPNAKEILLKSIAKCRTIESGYYELNRELKLMSDFDTVKILQKSRFMKLENDTVFSFAFHNDYFSKTMGNVSLLYTGEEAIFYMDSMGQLFSKDKADEIRTLFIKNIIFHSYFPIANKKDYPISGDDILGNKDLEINLIGEDIIQDMPCYHIKIKTDAKYDKSTIKSMIAGIEYDYWINKQDYIPIQYSIAKDFIVGDNILTQYEKHTLTKYELNNLEDKTILTMASLPSNLKFIEINGDGNAYELLSVGALAPDFELSTTTDETIRLSHLKGKVVLLDFFLTSCPPCIVNIPHLREIGKKYENKGLWVIGINSSSYNRNDLTAYIDKYEINYPILTETMETRKAYGVSFFPTTYLISKEGKVLFQHIGEFNEESKQELEEIIRNSL